MFRPHPPGFLGYIVINLSSQVVVEGRLVQSGQFPFQFHAEDGVRHTLPYGQESVNVKIITRESGWASAIGLRGSAKDLSRKPTPDSREAGPLGDRKIISFLLPWLEPCSCPEWTSTPLQK